MHFGLLTKGNCNTVVLICNFEESVTHNSINVSL